MTPRRWCARLSPYAFAFASAGGWVGAARASPAQDYMLYCMGCHGAQAEGVPGRVPPLAHALGRFIPLASVLATRREVVRDLAATGPAPPATY
jgi:hypothetical protein